MGDAGDRLKPVSAVPATAAGLGGAGLLPFVAGAALAWIAPAVLVVPAATIVALYGAIILSFLGGTLWGLASAPGGDTATNRPAAGAVMAVSVLPSLAAWISLFLSTRTALVVLAALFAAQLAADGWAVRLRLAPPWWLRLRLPLSLVVVACCLLAAAAPR